jgi:two-component system, LytTR family, sensor kinase
MKSYSYDPARLRKIELFSVAGLLLLILIIQVFCEGDYWLQHLPAFLIRGLTFFGLFVALNNKILPEALKMKNLWLNGAFAIILFFLTTAAIEMSVMMLQAEDESDKEGFYFTSSFMLAWCICQLYCFYFFVKSALIYLFFNTETAKRFRLMVKDALVAVVVWLVALLLLVLGRSEGELILAWTIVPPCTILLYAWLFVYVAPRALPKKRSFLIYLLYLLAMLVITLPFMGFLCFLLTGNDDFSSSIAGINFFLQLMILSVPYWLLIKRHIKGNEELYVLKKELNQSVANLDMLRSQINPHFLFNALNTVYGLAMRENAERTVEAVAKLSDMMRFMLQENMKEAISLKKEVEYLLNYIDLQKLKTGDHSNISLEIMIQEDVPAVTIAPMLLIPFVENAFKHGISFREPSLIRIVLKVEGSNLYFDVYNSKHEKIENDPEKYNNGVGLNNVKQRLKLLYPGKHQLQINDTNASFFIHLSMQLN